MATMSRARFIPFRLGLFKCHALVVITDETGVDESGEIKLLGPEEACHFRHFYGVSWRCCGVEVGKWLSFGEAELAKTGCPIGLSVIYMGLHWSGIKSPMSLGVFY
jgi:hypothetical protein